MADYIINPGGPGISGSIFLRIDNDADEIDRSFIIEHDSGGGANELFSVNEGGRVKIYGALRRDDVHRVDNTNANGDIAAFETQGTLVAKVTNLGVGVFFGGIRLLRNTGASNPQVAGLAGQTGQVILWNNSGTGLDEVWACNSGAGSTWNRATV